MNDDELIERLRRTLDTEASTVTSPDDAWERFQATAGAGRNRADRRRSAFGRSGRRVRFAVPVGVVGLAAALLVVVLVSGGAPSHSTRVASAPAGGAETGLPPRAAASNGAASSPTTVPGSTATSAAGAAVPRSGTATTSAATPIAFAPQSVTFVSPLEGWVLGRATCSSSPCETVEHTADGGRTWTALGVAPAGTGSNEVRHLRFADPVDGWAWGQTALWSTHDGGRTWSPQTIPGVAAGWTIEDLATSAGLAHVAVTQDGGIGVRLATTAAGADAWRLSPLAVSLGAGPVPTGQFVLQGDTGWFVQVDRTVVAGARLSGGTWQSWTPPCAEVNGPAVLAASSSTELVAACDAGVWGPSSTPQGEHLFASHDGGSTWVDAGAVPSQFDTGVASPSRGVVIAAGSSTASDGSLLFEETIDGGRSWSRVYHGPANAGVTDLGFTTATQGVAVLVGPDQAGSLLMTRDGGHTWSAVTFP